MARLRVMSKAWARCRASVSIRVRASVRVRINVSLESWLGLVLGLQLG